MRFKTSGCGAENHEDECKRRYSEYREDDYPYDDCENAGDLDDFIFCDDFTPPHSER